MTTWLSFRWFKFLIKRLAKRFARLTPGMAWEFTPDESAEKGFIIKVTSSWVYEGQLLNSVYWLSPKWIFNNKKRKTIDQLLATLLTMYRSDYIVSRQEKEKRLIGTSQAVEIDG